VCEIKTSVKTETMGFARKHKMLKWKTKGLVQLKLSLLLIIKQYTDFSFPLRAIHNFLNEYSTPFPPISKERVANLTPKSHQHISLSSNRNTKVRGHWAKHWLDSFHESLEYLILIGCLTLKYLWIMTLIQGNTVSQELYSSWL